MINFAIFCVTYHSSALSAHLSAPSAPKRQFQLKRPHCDLLTFDPSKVCIAENRRLDRTWKLVLYYWEFNAEFFENFSKIQLLDVKAWNNKSLLGFCLRRGLWVMGVVWVGTLCGTWSFALCCCYCCQRRIGKLVWTLWEVQRVPHMGEVVKQTDFRFESHTQTQSE